MKEEKEYKIGSDFELHALREKVGNVNKYSGSYKNRSDFDLYPVKGKKGEDAADHNLHALQYMNLGFFLITPIVMGVILGSFIDGKLHTRPVATIFFLLLGVVASFYNLFRMIKTQ